MKTRLLVALILISAISLIIYSCARDTFKSGTEVPVVATLDASGNATVISPDKLKTVLGEYFGVSQVTTLTVKTNDKGITYMVGGGPTKTGYMTFGFALKSTKEYLMYVAGCTQKCISSNCCNGCELTITSDCGGHCSCSGSNFCDTNTAPCTHEVTSGGGGGGGVARLQAIKLNDHLLKNDFGKKILIPN